jgi:hypothetical protein
MERQRPPFYPLVPERTTLEVREPPVGAVLARYQISGVCTQVYASDGPWVLITSVTSRASPPVVAVWDLPPPGPFRWRAAGLAVLTAAFGLILFVTVRRRRAPREATAPVLGPAG